MPSNSERKLSILIVTNTVGAITIGLLIANVLHPRSGGYLSPSAATAKVTIKRLDPWNLSADIIPDSVVKPLIYSNVISLIFVALAFGIVLRAIKTEQINRINQKQSDYLEIEQAIGLLFDAVIRILQLGIALVPIIDYGFLT